MPPLPIDRAPLSAQRTAMADLQARLRSLRQDAIEAQNALSRAQMQSASPDQLQQLDRRASEAKDRVIKAQAQWHKEQSRLGDLMRELLPEKDPTQLVESLTGAQPVALLPVRLQTRYLDQGQRLAVRIYPDTLHAKAQAPGLTDTERQAGAAYWAARAAGEGAEQAIWERMVAAYEAPRARYVVGATDPALSDSPAAQDALTRQTVACLLPSRFCAVGYVQHDGQLTEVLRAWGEPVPDELPMDLPLDPAQHDPGETPRNLGPQREWMFDYDAARAVGLGIDLTAEHLQHRLGKTVIYRWGDRLDRLVVVGVDWSRSPTEAADALEALLASHAASDGLACVPLGTPTNHTGPQAGAQQAPMPDAQPPANPSPADAAPHDAHRLLTHALGLSGTVLTPHALPGSELREQRTQMHMINALWPALLGRYLSEMWNAIGDNRQITPASVALARDFAVGWVRPGGPLPLLRVGDQPYGLLPVVAHLEPADSTEHGVLTVMRHLRPAWAQATARAPRLDGANFDSLRELLQTGPWSQVAQFRNIENPNKSQSPTGMRLVYGGVQLQGKSVFTDALLRAFGIDPPLPTLLETVVHDVQAHSLGHLPWVQADPQNPQRERAPGEPLDPPYIAHIAAALDAGGSGRLAQLAQHQNGDALLQALLAFSAQISWDAASIELLEKAIALSPDAGRVSELIRSTISANLVGVSAPTPPAAADGVVHIQNLQQLQAVTLPQVTGSRTLAEQLQDHLQATPSPSLSMDAAAMGLALPGTRMRLPFHLSELGAVRDSLLALAPLNTGELDTAFRLTLDLFSYRLDAWATGLANKRLGELRADPQARSGVHLGAWGVVLDLAPDTRPDSLGYIHAPSLPQAVAGAMLRSGALANAEGAEGAFDIHLDSARTHMALDLIDAMTQGQSPAALLGYRFERALRDTPDFAGAAYIYDLRLAYPLRPSGTTADDEPAEHIAARDVVDGLALLDAWRHQPSTVLAPVQPPHRDLVGGILNALAEIWDAVADLSLAESVYQVANNNLERAGAACAMVDALGPPVLPQVARTPRAGASYAQRLMLLCPDAPPPAAWADVAARDPLAAAEPRLDAWLARMLGEPQHFAFTARCWLGDALDGELVLRPTDLGRSALALVRAAAPDSSGLSPLRRWLVDAFSARLTPTPGLRLDIQERNAPGAPPGLAEFEALAATLHTLIHSGRSATRHDLIVPDDTLEASQPDQGDHAGVIESEITARGDAALAALRSARAALTQAADDAAITTALRGAWPFGLREAEPDPEPADAQTHADWSAAHRARRDRVLAELDERLARDAAAEPATTSAQRIGAAIDRIRLAYGRDFPVLARLTLGAYATHISDSLTQAESLTRGDAFAVPGWLTQMACVREGVAHLASATAAHEALLDTSLHTEWALWQCPQRPGQAWAALPAAWAGGDPRAAAPQLAVAALGATALDGLHADTPLAAWVVDAWQENVPDRIQTTGLSFHYDAPAARPPQAVLLAVPPSLKMTHWTLEGLLASVHEAIDLAALRSVRPQDLEAGLGAILPANYLPQQFGETAPGVQLWQMVHRWSEHAVSAQLSSALGKN